MCDGERRARMTQSTFFRSSNAFCLLTHAPPCSSSYQPLHEPHNTGAATPRKFADPESATPVELVTVPALGAEWKASELRDMTKAGKRERTADARGRFWRDFSRGERGLFGRRWLSKRLIVFFCFGLVIACVPFSLCCFRA
jgi:hypothetical protein